LCTKKGRWWEFERFQEDMQLLPGSADPFPASWLEVGTIVFQFKVAMNAKYGCLPIIPRPNLGTLS
jgi:hypothetical protein